MNNEGGWGDRGAGRSAECIKGWSVGGSSTLIGASAYCSLEIRTKY